MSSDYTPDDSYTRIAGFQAYIQDPAVNATLDNGEAPDYAMPAGTCSETAVIASNVAGSRYEVIAVHYTNRINWTELHDARSAV